MKNNWKVKKFEDCLEKIVCTNKIQRRDFLETGKFPIISQEQDFVNGYWNDANDLFKVKKPVIIFGDHTQVLKYVDFSFVLGADGVKILQPIKDLNPKYFYYFLKSVEFKKLGYARHYRMLKDLSIYFPPLREQQRIVAILDEAFAAIAKAKEKAEKNLQNARELFDSYLQGVFANHGDGWEEKTLGDITTKIGSGATPAGGNASYKQSGISLVRSLNVYDDRFTTKNLAFIDDSQAKKLDNVTLIKGDVLLNITGASIARCHVVPKEILPARVNQHVSILRAKQELIGPNFLHYAIISKPEFNLEVQRREQLLRLVF